jgi:molybdopterin-guanine dinucleotide biosynthesis protein A
MGIDAIVLCGEGRASRAVFGRSKALLDVGGRPVFHRVVTALADAGRVSRLFLVGDKVALENALERYGYPEKPVRVVEQKKNIAENIWSTFLETLDGYTLGAERENLAVYGKMCLFVGGDCPLLTAAEIDQFLDGADMNRYDYITGLTEAADLKKFAPSGGKPGVVMAPFHVAEGLFRINNLHLGRPFAFRNRGAIQRLYNVRYQKNPMNALRLLRDLWGVRSVRSRVWLIAYMQLAMTARNCGFPDLSDRIRKRASMAGILVGAGDVLGLKVGVSITTCGGAAIDIDNEEDYRTIRERYDEWMTMLRGSAP